MCVGINDPRHDESTIEINVFSTGATGFFRFGVGANNDKFAISDGEPFDPGSRWVNRVDLSVGVDYVGFSRRCVGAEQPDTTRKNTT